LTRAALNHPPSSSLLVQQRSAPPPPAPQPNKMKLLNHVFLFLGLCVRACRPPVLPVPVSRKFFFSQTFLHFSVSCPSVTSVVPPNSLRPFPLPKPSYVSPPSSRFLPVGLPTASNGLRPLFFLRSLPLASPRFVFSFPFSCEFRWLQGYCDSASVPGNVFAMVFI